MPRKLKVYRASIGFFDLAVAAPSMKAAIEAWGANADIFHDGLAAETDDPKIVSAAMDQPGIVLRRPVGSDGAFKENAKLPKAPAEKREPAKPQPKSDDKDREDKRQVEEDKRQAAERERLAAERAAAERERLAAERKRAEEERLRRIAVADQALERARVRHDKALARIAKLREELEQAEKLEAQKWSDEQREHAAALKQANKAD